ncbi:MAG: DUF86 domain-containing protein [Acidobacteria bacterium]|nr:DUF86 domain-containing protein [Acidobacteriota bacterium]
MVDRATLDHLLSSLKAYLDVLDELANVPREAFLANRDKIGNAKYHFVIAIECAIDIANHLIASEGYRFPRDNADSFSVLLEHGIVDPAWLEALRGMARFRNRLVHLYWEVDDGRVYDYLQEGRGDLARFARTVAAHPWP